MGGLTTLRQNCGSTKDGIGAAGFVEILPAAAALCVFGTALSASFALGDGAAPMLHALLARAAADGVGRFDLIEVPPDSPLHDVKPPAAWEMTRSVGSPCPVLAPIAIPAAMRRNLRMSRNRSARIGGATTDHATAATLAPALDALIALHQARWTGQGEPGVLADPAVLRFHRLAAPGLLDAGLLRLTLLRIGGDPAAAAMMLLDRSRIHFYLSGYEVALRHVSPGTLIVGALLEQATIEGRSEVHFLRGDEAYKYAWGAVDRWNATISFTARR